MNMTVSDMKKYFCSDQLISESDIRRAKMAPRKIATPPIEGLKSE
jgi:hypothetical protein